MPRVNKSGFTEKQLLFIKYFEGKQEEAARKAGYKQAARSATELMSNLAIRAEIDKKIAAATKEAGKQMGRRITFSRNDIIMGLADLGGLGNPAKIAESDSARVTALGKLAEIFQIIPKGSKDVDIFADWKDEELEEYRRTGVIPARFGLSAADYNERHAETAGVSASAVPVSGGSAVGHGSSHRSPVAPSPQARK